MVGTITGGVWSTITVTVIELVSPSPFFAEQVSAVPGVLAVRVCVVQPTEEAMPVSGSVVYQLTVTEPVYQPFAPAVPVMVGVITGGVLSLLQGPIGGLPSA